MNRLRRLALLIAFALAAGGAAAATVEIEGVWAPLDAAGRPKCTGSVVHAFRAGNYARLVPETLSTLGRHPHLLGQGRYTVSGDRVEVEPRASMIALDRRRVFLIDRSDPPALVLLGEENIRLGRCAELDANHLIP